MQLTQEQVRIGQDNFHEAVGFTRRDFLKGAAATGLGLGAFYFGYGALKGERIRVAWIGTGDEGSVLINEHPEDYMDIVAVADLRPENREKAFHGDPRNLDARMGLIRKLGEDKAAEIRQNVYDDHRALLADKEKLGIQAVVIAVPLVGHYSVARDCLDAGLHVLSEKLMCHNIRQCKELIRTARKKGLLYAVGHQRHYNVLYENANKLVQMGLLGDIRFIRAQWHRNNSFPNRDSWRKTVWQQRPPLTEAERAELEQKVRDFGYDDMNHLVNWRLFNETGGGLMAELGSHQLDAASIFLGKVHPIAVQGYGGRNFYGVSWKEDGELHGVGPADKWTDDRDIDDHVYVTFEFPGPNYEHNDRDKCVVTYSSMNTNSSEPYGETVFGSRGTLMMNREQEALLYKESGPTPGGFDQRLWVISNKSGGGPVLDAYETSAPTATAAEAQAGMGKQISRGYREEMEHFCYCIEQGLVPTKENPHPEGGVRCDGVVAMADAIMALTSNRAMALQKRIEFQDAWFDPDEPDTPEADHPLPGEDPDDFRAPVA